MEICIAPGKASSLDIDVLDAGAHNVDDAAPCCLLLVCVCGKGKGAAVQREQRHTE